MNIGCVLLAAGRGIRFGENKLLYPVDGEPMVSRALLAAPAAWFARAVAVVSDAQVALLAGKAGYETVLNPTPQAGQGGSVALGAARMRGLDAALFCLGDQPYLTRETVGRLIGAWRPGDICALAHAGRRGNPVLFPAGCLEALAALAPRQNGRDVLAAYAGRVRLIEAGSGRELRDIDVPGDLRGAYRPCALGPPAPGRTPAPEGRTVR